MQPTEIVALMNDYLSAMTDIIEQEGGFVDKYIGDAIVAVFGAPADDPAHATSAVRAALLLPRTAAGDRTPSRRPFKSRPAGQRIGLNSGEVLVGNIGSRRRFNYTVMGDAVNLASRLEGANKYFGTAIMASETTVDATGAAFAWRELDGIRVKGRNQPVKIYEPLAALGEESPDRRRVPPPTRRGLHAGACAISRAPPGILRVRPPPIRRRAVPASRRSVCAPSARADWDSVSALEGCRAHDGSVNAKPMVRRHRRTESTPELRLSGRRPTSSAVTFDGLNRQYVTPNASGSPRSTMNAPTDGRHPMRGTRSIQPKQQSCASAPSGPSDQELVDRIGARRSNALRELMLRHRGAYNASLGVFCRTATVSTTYQRCFRRSVAASPRLRTARSVVTWLLAIAKFRAMSAHSEHRQREEAFDEVAAAKLVDHNDTPDVVMEQQDRAKLLRRLTAALPAQQARLIDLVYSRDKSVREVAAIVGIPNDTVKTRMYLARKTTCGPARCRGLRASGRMKVTPRLARI